MFKRTKPSLFLAKWPASGTHPLAHTYHYQMIHHTLLLGTAESCTSLVCQTLALLAKSLSQSTTTEQKNDNIDVLQKYIKQHINIAILSFSCGR